MYFGSDRARVTDLAFEAMCFALAGGVCGGTKAVSVEASESTIRVTDDGIGVSMELGPRGVPFAQRAMTELGACRDHKEHERLKHELCGVGLAAVNAISLSASLTRSDGAEQVRQKYTHGEPGGPFVTTGSDVPSGTTLEFELNPTFVAAGPFEESTLRAMVDDLSVDLSGLTLHIGGVEE